MMVQPASTAVLLKFMAGPHPVPTLEQHDKIAARKRAHDDPRTTFRTL
jgi:hypothetical protein